MIAADTNIWIALLNNENAPDLEILDNQFVEGGVHMPPVVLSELLSDPFIHSEAPALFEKAHLMFVEDGYWYRAGFLRAKMIAKKCKPKLPDTLIAQSCIDHDIPLLTRDNGFSIFAKYAGLRLVEA